MIFLELFFEIFFSSKKDNQIIKDSLFNQHCFSLPKSATYDRLIGLRQLKRNLFFIWRQNNHDLKKTYHNESNIFCFNLFPNDNINFINDLNNKKKINSTFSKVNLLKDLKFSQKIHMSSLLFIMYLFIAVLVFFQNNKRINIALFPEHILNSYILIKRLLTLNCKTLYFFQPHEPEANLISHILIKRGVYVLKVPNTNPLFLFNKAIIASKLILTLEYQLDELKIYDDKMKYKFKNPPSLTKYFNHKHLNSRNEDICYYSHASWLRKELDHNIPLFNEVKLEIDFLSYIKQQKMFNDSKITICLHPKEKESQNLLNKSKRYYKSIFGENINFYTQNSYDSFKVFNLGFGVLSTILFERIHCGFKTLLFSDLDEFPVEKSNFNRFVINDLKLADKLISKSVNTNLELFFSKSKNYTFQNSKFNSI